MSSVVSLENIENQCGTLVMNLQGQILSSSGDLKEEGKGGGNDSFSKDQLVYQILQDVHSFLLSISGPSSSSSSFSSGGGMESTSQQNQLFNKLTSLIFLFFFDSLPQKLIKQFSFFFVL
eukprot:TRINITY_DN3343_c0_g1_i1.p1 TRINITY_DN3343_c0_g1~~TRINITY_DN3343_c0_g1_i1.p1  ORF type:complete len:120 (-),score=43.85 TRINITY_DN3343_c0_g1_i1:93-452(-)